MSILDLGSDFQSYKPIGKFRVRVRVRQMPLSIVCHYKRSSAVFAGFEPDLSLFNINVKLTTQVIIGSLVQEQNRGMHPDVTAAKLVRESQSLAGKLQQLRAMMQANQMSHLQPGASPCASIQPKAEVNISMLPGLSTDSLQGLRCGSGGDK